MYPTLELFVSGNTPWNVNDIGRSTKEMYLLKYHYTNVTFVLYNSTLCDIESNYITEIFTENCNQRPYFG